MEPQNLRNAYQDVSYYALLIPSRDHPRYKDAIHRWSMAMQYLLKQKGAIMTLPNLSTRYIPTTRPDYRPVVLTFDEKQAFLDRLQQIERRLDNLEVLVRLQDACEDDGK
jgi:hypothetical protein